MALLLRTISNAKWVKDDWMVAGDVPADALSDLRTARNALSVWNVDPELENLNGVLTALASNRDQLDKVDYTLIDENLLPIIAIECVKSPANTPYSTLNAAHRFDKAHSGKNRGPGARDDAVVSCKSTRKESKRTTQERVARRPA